MITQATSFLSQQSSIIQDQIMATTALLQHLSPEQLAWQPAPNKWSIVQCLEHLNISMGYYLPEMKKEIDAAIQRGILPNENFQSGFWGKRLPRMFEPKKDKKIGWKMKTMKRFQPVVSVPAQAATIEQFHAYLQDALAICELSRQTDLDKVRVVSALGSMLKFKLGDCFRFVLAHNARHILQAQNVRAAEGFPE